MQQRKYATPSPASPLYMLSTGLNISYSIFHRTRTYRRSTKRRRPLQTCTSPNVRQNALPKWLSSREVARTRLNRHPKRCPRGGPANGEPTEQQHSSTVRRSSRGRQDRVPIRREAIPWRDEREFRGPYTPR